MPCDNAASPFVAQHQRLVTRKISNGGDEPPRRVNIGHNALGWLAGRKNKQGAAYITWDQLDAAGRFAADYERAGLQPRTTAQLSDIPVSQKKRGASRDLLPHEAQLAARQRIREIAAEMGPSLTDVLVRVACFNEGLEQIEETLDWPRRSARVAVQIALERLLIIQRRRELGR